LKIKVKYFVSYAQRNAELASKFLDKYYEQVLPSVKYSHESWSDRNILVGEKWHSEIQRAINICSYGLLLVSPAFLGSKYIVENELAQLVRYGKLLVPVILQPINFNKHDLHGLDKHQLYRLRSPSLSSPKSFYECKRHRRDEFAAKIFEEVEDRLDKVFSLK